MEIYIGKNNEKLGPFALDEIKQGLEEGRFTAEDLAWYEGCDGWIPLTSIPDLQISLPDIPLPEQAAQAPAPPMAELASRGRRLMAVLVDGVVSLLWPFQASSWRSAPYSMVAKSLIHWESS